MKNPTIFRIYLIFSVSFSYRSTQKHLLPEKQEAGEEIYIVFL